MHMYIEGKPCAIQYIFDNACLVNITTDIGTSVLQQHELSSMQLGTPTTVVISLVKYGY